ncbi:MAG: site-specific integrase [Actinomycetota bacterium]
MARHGPRPTPIQVGPDRWRLRITTADGSRAQRTITGTEHDAAVELARWLRDEAENANRADQLAPDGIARRPGTVGELVNEWWALRSDELSPATRSSWRSALTRHVLPRWADTRPEHVTVAELEDWYRGLLDGMGPDRIKTIRGVLVGVLDVATRRGDLPVNPARTARTPKGTKRQVRPPTPEQVRALIDHLPAGAVRTFVVVMASTGARRGELCAVRWDAIEHAPDGPTLIIRDAVSKGDGAGVQTRGTTKTNRVRRVALGDGALAVLEQWRIESEEIASQLGVTIGPGSFVWPQLDPTVPYGTRPIYPDTVTKAFRRARDELGLPARLRLYDLRHFTVTQLMGAGVDLQTIADRTGNQRPDTLLRFYSGFVPERDRDAAGILDDIVN